ncbi:hypothetical protein N9368_05305 [Alphaproteobacteria bacterium]|nr:hypothetical protein [Alphaproteobacteria bacterium]
MVIELAVITIGSFLAAVVNAMFATGGIHLLLASTTAVLPVAIAIPLQSVLARILSKSGILDAPSFFILRIMNITARSNQMKKDAGGPANAIFTLPVMMGRLR